MGTFLLRRLIQMILTLFVSSVTIFLLIYLIPGGPFDNLVRSGRPRQNQVVYEEQLRKSIGLDKPVYVRYGEWIGNMITKGDFGKSWLVQKGVPINDILHDRILATLQITVSSLLFSILVGLSIGIFSALKPYSIADYAITSLTFLGISIPVFWLGFLLLVLFYSTLHWLPAGGMMNPRAEELGAGGLADHLKHLVLPVLTLSILSVAGFSRFMRASMLEVFNQDYIRTARAKGLREQSVIFKHALRNAMIPVITVVALSIPGLIAGAPITETIFSWPGLGQLLITAVFTLDAPIAQAILILIALLTVIANMLADVLYAAVDPRVRLT